MLRWDNYKINLFVKYNRKELEEWENKTKEEKAKSNF